MPDMGVKKLSIALDERVAESVAVGSVGADDGGRHPIGEGAFDRFVVEAGDLGEDLWIERATQHGSGREDAPAVGGEHPDALRDRFAHIIRKIRCAGSQVHGSHPKEEGLGIA